MSEFFGRLETELRAAAERPPRRTLPAPAVMAVALVALALAPIVIVLGSGGDEPPPERRAAEEAPRADSALAPVGSTMPKNLETGTPAYRPVATTVVATGVAPVTGPWQLETFDSRTGACLGLFLVHAPPDTVTSSVICPGSGRRPLPGFSAQAMAVPARPTQEEFLVYGPAPEEAAAVELVDDGNVLERVETSEGPESVPGDFYLMTLPPDLTLDGTMRWVGDDGRTGDEGRFQLP